VAALALPDGAHAFLLAQRYVDNPGFDLKLYVTGTQVYAVRKKSPLHPDVHVTEGLIPVTPELRTLALNVGALFGLELYGVDVVQSAEGWVGVDINDFPSFGGVPGAVPLIATFLLHVARRAARQRPVRARRPQRRQDGTVDGRSWRTDAESVRTAERPRRGILTRRRHIGTVP
jgi:ribosomal protein S6--L-glutamate ligase